MREQRLRFKPTGINNTNFEIMQCQKRKEQIDKDERKLRTFQALRDVYLQEHKFEKKIDGIKLCLERRKTRNLIIFIRTHN